MSSASDPIAHKPMTTVSGWGRTPSSAAYVTPVAVEDDAVGVLTATHARGVLARGLGRSYGDAALNAGGDVLDMTPLDRVLHLDVDTGVIDVESGVSLELIMRRAVPVGWFVPVTPGTRHVTVGGAIAADVHGKNHHLAGSFGRHVLWIDLMHTDAAGQSVVSRFGPDAPEFWATVGGMGLTGVVLRAGIQLTAVPSAYVSVDTRRASGLDELMTLLVDNDDRYPYSVAWIDCTATGPAMGRGVVTWGRFAEQDALPGGLALKPRAFNPAPLATIPDVVPSRLLNATTVRAFNALWFRKAPWRRSDEIQSIGQFFHPLDGLSSWNRLYGRAGFLQYQFVVPDEAADVVATAIERLAGLGAPSFLAVLKRFGPASGGLLSFPMAGWTLALDIPTTVPGLADGLDALDELVVGAGGRIYLAKDSRMSSDHVAAMYPRLSEWRSVRDRLDPTGVFQSDLARRLAL